MLVKRPRKRRRRSPTVVRWLIAIGAAGAIAAAVAVGGGVVDLERLTPSGFGSDASNTGDDDPS